MLTPVGCHDAPCRSVWRYSYAEEAEGGFGEDEGADAEASDDEDGSYDSGEDVSEEDAGLRCALDAGVADVVGFSEGEGFGAYDAGEVVPAEEYEKDNDEFEALAENYHYYQCDEEERHCKREVDGAHCGLVYPSATVASDQSDNGAADSSGEDYCGRDDRGDPSTVDGSAQDVSTLVISS